MFDAILADAGIKTVLSGVPGAPHERDHGTRWMRTCRRELLDRTLICNQRHLLHALREYERFYNLHRPHQGIATASAVSSTNTSTPPDCPDGILGRYTVPPTPRYSP
jgi:putative transposase